MHSLFVHYLSYADYDYLISPFHTHCYLFLAPYAFPSVSSLCSFLRSHRRNKHKTNTIDAILVVQRLSTGTPYKGLSLPGPMARDRSSSPSPGAKRIDDVVLSHQFTPSWTSSKLVELPLSRDILVLNHSLHTSPGSQVITLSPSLMSLESICSGLGVGLVTKRDAPPEATLVPTELGVRWNEVW